MNKRNVITKQTGQWSFLMQCSLHSLGVIAMILVAGAITTAQAQTVFSQDFSSSTTLSDYVGSGVNKFDGITTTGSNFAWSINSEALSGVRSNTNTGEFSRTTDLATSTGAIYKFDLNVTASTTAATSAMTFQVGANYTTSNSTETNANTHSRFTITLNSNGSYGFRDVNASTAGADTFTGSQSVFFVANNTGSSLTYSAPDGSAQTVADDKWDLWIGNTQEFDERGATTGSIAPTDFKLTWNGGTGTSFFDNFEVVAVPEPATILGGLLMLGALGWSQRRRLGGLAGSMRTRLVA